MHDCLETPEIVRLIVGYLSPYAHQDTLLSLAQVKVFSDTALNVLWRELDTHETPNITHLFRFLPKDAWKRDSMMMVITRPLTSEEWSRVRFYSQRVQSLEIGVLMGTVDLSTSYDSDCDDDSFCSDDSNDDPFFEKLTYIQDIDTLKKSILMKSPSPLFPNLQKLSLMDPVAPRIAETLITNKLAELDVFGTQCRDLALLDTIFGLLKKRCTSLESLRIFHDYSCASKFHSQPSFPLIRSLKRVSIGISCVDEPLLHTLECIPYLEDLDLRAMNRKDCTVVPQTAMPRRNLVPSLRKLRLNMGLHQISPLLEILPCGQLCEISLIAWVHLRHTIPITFKTLIDEIAAKCDVLSLVDIALRVKVADSKVGLGPVPISFDTVHPLFEFKKLVHFQLQPSSDENESFFLDITNGDMPSLAESWPYLRNLEIGGTPFQSQTTLTIKGLQPLAVHCPALKYLSVSVDAREDNQLPVRRAGGGNCGGSLCRLELRSSPIQDGIYTASDTAALLTSIFPNLDELEYIKSARHNCQDHLYWQSWNTVDTFLDIFVKVRRQENLTLKSCQLSCGPMD